VIAEVMHRSLRAAVMIFSGAAEGRQYGEENGQQPDPSVADSEAHCESEAPIAVAAGDRSG